MIYKQGPSTVDLVRALMTAALAAHMSGLDGDVEMEPYIVATVRIPLTIASAVIHHPRYSEMGSALAIEQFCRVCGCTYWSPCEDGCAWVEPDLCSACVPRVPLVIQEQIEVAG